MKKRLLIIAAVFILIGIACAVAYSLIGSYVDEAGMLHEPFGLIPIGYLSVFIGLVIGIVGLIKK